jgi:hypothetical protein
MRVKSADTTEHLVIEDPQAGVGPERLADPPLRYDPSDPLVAETYEPEPPPAGPPPLMALPLETILAALRRLVVPTREISADDWAPWRVNLNDVNTIVVANRHAGRRSLLLVNLAAAGGATAYIGSRINLSPGGINTFPIAAGATFTLNGTGPVYGCTDAGASLQLAVVAEYDTAATGEL